MTTPENKDLAEYIHQNYKRPIEVGVGHRPEVAEILEQRGLPIRTTDIRWRTAPGFTLDDVTQPQLDVYQGADLIFSIRPPEEIWIPLARLAQKVNADLIIRPLASEQVDLSRFFDHCLVKSYGRARFLLFTG